MSRPRILTDDERIQAAINFTEGMRVRVASTHYSKSLPYLQKGSTGTVAPRQAWQLVQNVEVQMDNDPGDDSWPWYPEELEAI